MAWRSVEILQKGGIMARMNTSALLGAAIEAFSARICPENERLESFAATPPKYALVMTGLANIIVRCVPKCVPTMYP